MQCFVGRDSGSRSRQYHQVEAAEPRVLVPKRLARNPLQPVAVDRAPRRLARDREPQPRVVAIVGRGDDGKQGIADTPAAAKRPPVVVRLDQAQCARESRRCHPLRRPCSRNPERLRAQPGTAFGATCLQDPAAVLGRHTGTEAVRAFAVQIAGLVSSFHVAVRWPGRRACGQVKGRILERFAAALSTGTLYFSLWISGGIRYRLLDDFAGPNHNRPIMTISDSKGERR